MSLKILFGIGQLTLGGSERRLLDLYEELINRGYKCRISNISGDHVNDGKEVFVRKNKLKRIFDTMKEISEFKPDIIQSFDLQSSYYLKLALILLRKKTPIIAGFGASKFVNNSVKNLLNNSFLQPDCYVLNSKKGVELIADTLKFDKKIYFIPNGLNIDRFNYPKVDLPEWTNRNNIVGYIGKLNESKHGERIIEIAKEFEKSKLDVNFVVIGEGPYFNESVEVVDSDPYLKKHVVLTGNIDNAAALIKYFKIGVLCSDTEGLPNVLLEYMAQGIPSISTDVGDCRDVLDNGRCGIVIDKYDKHLFKESIIKLLNNEQFYKELSINSQKRFAQEYNIKKMTDNYLNLYAEILK